MKIEVTCSNCQAVLRVAAEHAGKKLRCPTCGSLCDIPMSNQPFEDDWPDNPPPNDPKPPPVDRGTPDPDYKPPIYIGPHSAPMEPDGPASWSTDIPRQPPPVPVQNDDAIGKSYLMFGLGVVSCFVCGCLSLVITPVLFCKGMSYAKQVNTSDSSVAFYLNLSGLIVWALFMLGFAAVTVG